MPFPALEINIIIKLKKHSQVKTIDSIELHCTMDQTFL